LQFYLNEIRDLKLRNEETQIIHHEIVAEGTGCDKDLGNGGSSIRDLINLRQFRTLVCIF